MAKMAMAQATWCAALRRSGGSIPPRSGARDRVPLPAPVDSYQSRQPQPRHFWPSESLMFINPTADRRYGEVSGDRRGGKKPRCETRGEGWVFPGRATGILPVQGTSALARTRAWPGWPWRKKWARRATGRVPCHLVTPVQGTSALARTRAWPGWPWHKKWARLATGCVPCHPVTPEQGTSVLARAQGSPRPGTML